MGSTLKCSKKKYYSVFPSSSSSSSSEDELEEIDMLEKKRGQFSSSRVRNERNHLQAHQNIVDDYFSESPRYSATLFRRRFRMILSLYLRILSVVEGNEPYFQQKRNAANKLGLSALQKVVASFRMLANGVSVDFVDEYIKIGESTTTESLKYFVKTVISVFGDEYLRSPNNKDIARLLAIGEERDFPGMLCSIDCMHWKWKNCPSAWKEQSSVFSKLAEGRAPPVNYYVNGRDYTMGYYLADGIYPAWATFVKTIPQPLGNKKKYFAQWQESTRKDVERIFGVLQARFAILKGPAHFFYQETLKNIMMACIIMHNMIIEDERVLHPEEEISPQYEQVNREGPPEKVHDTTGLEDFINVHYRIRDRDAHSQLQNDLVEHLWNKYSMS